MENNFENSLKELESIVSSLESDEISLDRSIELFEKGIKLSNECRKTLETAERKIKTLTECENENG